MKFFTKEWHELSDYMIAVEPFEPVQDKDYTDEDFEHLYEEMLDKYLQEEKELYEEPPYFDLDEWKADFPKDEFDPEDFLIADITEDGEETNFRHPESYEELIEYQRKNFLNELDEYEHMEPFNAEEEKEFFEEMYKEALAAPDQDIPKWIRDSVDPRLLALGILPESIYKKMKAEEQEKSVRFEELENRIEEYYDEQEGTDDPEYDRIDEILSDLECAELLYAGEKEEDYIIKGLVWDEDDMQTTVCVVFSKTEIIENEEPNIDTEIDEDGDIVSCVDLMDYELYKEDGKYEVHMLFSEEGENELRYVTLKCEDVCFQ